MKVIPSPPLPTPPRRAAFTLTELIWVMALIALLMSLLLPILGRGLTIARRIDCAQRLRQWSAAQLLYAQDNDDRIARESHLPNGVTLNTWGEVAHGFSRDVWYNALPEHLGLPRAADFKPSVLRPDFYRRTALFHCPSARFPPRANEMPVAFFSLAMNSKLILRPQSTIRLGEIQRPSATVHFLENRLPDEPKAQSDQVTDALGQPSAYANRFSTRHQRLGNLAFLDGHLEARPAHQVITNGFAIYPQVNLSWTADPARNPNHDW